MNDENSLSNFFEEFLDREPLFQSKKALQSNYTPDTLLHRGEQVKVVAGVLAPCLRNDRPSNLFIYGKTGTGKTCVVQHVTKEMNTVANQRNIPLKILYLNCKIKKIADTEYRLIAQLARDLDQEIPATGLPTDDVYTKFFKAVDQKKQILVIVLDEIDQLVKKAGDEILYNLTRYNTELKNAQISVIGISNDLLFADNIDPRVKSSLSEEEVVFPPYNALQIQDILKRRAELAFREGTLAPGVIEKCAAYAAREHGDARRALELLRVTGEISERKGLDKVDISHIDEAEAKIERDRVVDIVLTQPKQQQATLFSIIAIGENNPKQIFTGEVYELYREICVKAGIRPLTQRRVSDVIAELDMLGIINAKIISKGRYGRTREITLTIPAALLPKIKKILQEGLY